MEGIVAFYQTYECPFCNGVFNHLHHKFSSKEISPPPDYCPLCGANVGVKKTKRKPPKPKPYVPTSGDASTKAKRINKSADQVYRQMEDTSVNRMNQAAEMLGMTPDKLSYMKTTNMRDNVKVGESSYMPPSTIPAPELRGQETKMTFASGEQIKSHFGGQALPGQGSLTSGQPNKDLQNAMNVTLSQHQNRVQATVAAGIKK